MASIPTTSPQHSLELDCQWLDDFRNDVAKGTTVFSDNTVFKLCHLAGETRPTVKVVNVKPGKPFSFGLSVENLYALIDRATAHLTAQGAPKSFYENDDTFLARIIKHNDSPSCEYTLQTLLRLHNLAGAIIGDAEIELGNLNPAATRIWQKDSIAALIRRALARNTDTEAGPDVSDGPVEDGFAPGFEERSGKPKHPYVSDIPDDNQFVDRLERIMNKGFHLTRPEFERLANLAGIDIKSIDWETVNSDKQAFAEDLREALRFARENLAKRAAASYPPIDAVGPIDAATFVDRLEKIVLSGITNFRIEDLRRLTSLARLEVLHQSFSFPPDAGNLKVETDIILGWIKIARTRLEEDRNEQIFGRRLRREPDVTTELPANTHAYLTEVLTKLKDGTGITMAGFNRLGDIAKRLAWGDFDTMTKLNSEQLLAFVAKLQELAFIEMSKRGVITSDDTAAQFLDRMRREVAHKVVFEPADIERLEALAGIPVEFRNSKDTSPNILVNVRALIESAEERLGLLRIAPENPPPPFGRPDTGPQGAVGHVGPPTTTYRLVHMRGGDTLVHNVVSERFLREVLELTLADGSRRLFPLYHFRDVHTNWKGGPR